MQFTEDQIAESSERARNDLHQSAESSSRLIADQKRRLAELERHKQKLVDAYMADALPLEELKPRRPRWPPIAESDSSRAPRPPTRR